MKRHATDRFLTAVLLSASGALLALFAGQPQAALLVAPWLVVLTVGMTRTALDAPTASIELSSDRVIVGDDIEATTELRGPSGSVRVTYRPSPGFSRSDEHSQSPAQASEAIVAGEARVTCTLRATEWGTHDLGRVTIELTEPYGLFRSIGHVRQPAFVRVHPNSTQLRHLLAPRLVRRVSGAHGSSQVGRGVEYADVRPFTSGDSLRDINWRATARSTDLWVSQRHPDRATDVVLLLDSFVEAGHDVRTTVGMAIEATISLADSHLAVTDRVGLVEIGGVVRWVQPGTGRLQLQRLTDAVLATSLHANAAERDLRVIPPRALPPRSFVVALSPLLDDRFTEALFTLAGHGHDVAVIECELAGDDHDPSNSGRSALVARRLWDAERQVTRDRLAQLGIVVSGWERSAPLDLVLDDLKRRRNRTASRRR